MDYVETELLSYIKRFPMSTREYLSDRLVRQRKMTAGEFAGALNNLYRSEEIYDPTPGRILATYGKHQYNAKGDIKGKQIKLKPLKPKIYKSSRKTIKRKWREGYQCSKCGKWFKRDWNKKRPVTCPKCHAHEPLKASYYDKRLSKLVVQIKKYDLQIVAVDKNLRRLKERLGGVRYRPWRSPQEAKEEEELSDSELVARMKGSKYEIAKQTMDATKKMNALNETRERLKEQLENLENKHLLKRYPKNYQRVTPHYKKMLGVIEPSRVDRPGLHTRFSVTKYISPPADVWSKYYIEPVIQRMEERKRKKRVEYAGSEEAKKAGEESWKKRREHGWKPKAKPAKPKIIMGNVRLSTMQIAGYQAGATRQGRVLVGFYKDKNGKIRPITKSARAIKQVHVVHKPKKFKSIKPKARRKKAYRKKRRLRRR